VRSEPTARPGVRRRLAVGHVRDALLHLPRPLQPTRLRSRQEWSIGVLAGPTILDLAPVPGVRNPVLTAADVDDVPADLVADPFLVSEGGSLQLFFEVLNRRSGRGEIGLATSSDGRSWSYRGRVLAEPFHLSYPHVLRWGGELYLVPECGEVGEVRLYRATDYPTGWERVATLLSGGTFHDPTPFEHAGSWWMFVETDPLLRSSTLRLFHAPSLLGPWQEHPSSPLREDDPRSARPAGRVLFLDGSPVRLAQDCEGEYGRRVHAFEVTTLSGDEYLERPMGTVLEARGAGWNHDGMHHLDAMRCPNGSWFAVADGRAPGRRSIVADRGGVIA
jgi:hypothetical protein